MSHKVDKYTIQEIQGSLGNPPQLIIKDILIGKDEAEAWVLYLNGLSNKEQIDKDILTPLMLHIDNNIKCIKNLSYLCKKYLTLSNVIITSDIYKCIDEIKRGRCLIIVKEFEEIIIADTVGGEQRRVSEPLNESSIRGPRESFVENIGVNISLLKRRLKDKNLCTEDFKVGLRSQTDVALVYIKDIANDSIVKEIVKRLQAIDIDSITASSFIEQMIEKHTYSIFPQVYATERPDGVVGSILEGRVAIICDGTPYALLAPSIFGDFFEAPDDYLHRTAHSSILRIIRLIAVIVIILFPALYVCLVKFNSELIPLEAVTSMVEARRDIAFSPFASILIMGLTIEFIREGGLRLPGKIGQTLSVVGGIIIGDAALQAKIIAPTTLLVVGFTTVATFVIPNYEMALSIRLLSYPILILGNFTGMYGVIIGCFFILCYLCSLDSFGIPYFYFRRRDFKDTIIRNALWKMDERPQIFQTKDVIRQGSPDRKNGEQNE